MFSTSLCSTAIHLLPPANGHLNSSRRSSTTLTNGKLTRSSTLSDATGSCIISYNGRVTFTYGLTGNLRRMSEMHRNWLMSFTESTRGSLNDDWTGRAGLDGLQVVLLCLLSYGSWAGINGVSTGFYHLPVEVEFPHGPHPP